MNLPTGWTRRRAAGVWPQYYLIHTPCGVRSAHPIDLLFSEGTAQRHIDGHECPTDGA